jgi:predicted nucleotidyltransferase
MKKDVKKKLEELGILVVYVFGSRAIGRESRLSDLDLGVVLKTPVPGKDTRSLYTKLYQLFSAIYPSSKKVDIVFLQSAPLSLQYYAVKEGKILFEEDSRLRADYENMVVKQYLDFRPVLDFFDRVTMERYGEA